MTQQDYPDYEASNNDHTGLYSNPDSDTPGESATEGYVESKEPSRFGRFSRRLGWISLAVFLLTFFTFIKLPQERLKATIQGHLTAILSEQGITLSAAESSISFGWGISYELRRVTLRFSPTQPGGPAPFPVQLDRIGVSPSLLPLLTGKRGGKFWLTSGEGKLSGSAALRGRQVFVTFDAKQLDLKRIGLAQAASLSASALFSGSGSFRGDPANLLTLEGDLRSELKSIVIDQQLIQGFTIPRLAISEATIDGIIEKGKLRIREFRVGREGATPADDIRATLTGEITLGRDIPSSTLNLKTRFSLSPAVIQAFPLVDAILSAGKLPDGSYSFQLSGPATSAIPSPVAP